MFQFPNITPLRKRRFVRPLNSDGYAIVRIVATGLTADETREYPEATLRDFVAPMQDNCCWQATSSKVSRLRGAIRSLRTRLSEQSSTTA